jgi:hypothetical protein
MISFVVDSNKLTIELDQTQSDEFADYYQLYGTTFDL